MEYIARLILNGDSISYIPCLTLAATEVIHLRLRSGGGGYRDHVTLWLITGRHHTGLCM